MLALRLPPEIEARLAELASRTGRTKSFYAREAILNHLDELEDLYLAESRLEDLREGRSESIPLNDLIRRHAVEDWVRAPPRASSTSSDRNPRLAFFASFAIGSPLSRSIGQALKGDRFGEFWRHRIGDYRVIARIEDAEALILALRIGHRREVRRWRP
jgi:RHH-type transcriptional regulator, rel operon repressor / antitoxin RelB